VCAGYRDHTGAARRFLGESKAALIGKDRVVRVIAGSDLHQFSADVAKWALKPARNDAQRCLICHTRIPTQ
jgi:hypothetical protein